MVFKEGDQQRKQWRHAPLLVVRFEHKRPNVSGKKKKQKAVEQSLVTTPSQSWTFA